jgi:two-component system response regulator FixJ
MSRLQSEPTTMSETAIVHIIDDEADVRHSMELLLEGEGLRTRSYISVDAFFESGGDECPGCVVTDLRMPGASGIDLLTRLQQSGAALPVIVVSAHTDVALAVHAMKKGAADFIGKPFSAERLVEAVRAAIERVDRDHGEPPPRASLSMLSKREHEVLGRVLAGKSNKIIGRELEISERTVESHRASIMRKTGARNLAELVRLAAKQG